MSDVSNRAECYRELAEGCRRLEGCRHLAAIGLSTETRNHLLWMAEHYSTLADAEERSFEGYPAKVQHT
jgi:hypothetical protein